MILSFFVSLIGDRLGYLESFSDTADRLAIDRFLRSLAANGLMEQVPVEKFKPNQFCMELAKPDFHTLTNF